jgi:hypothetical protein
MKTKNRFRIARRGLLWAAFGLALLAVLARPAEAGKALRVQTVRVKNGAKPGTVAPVRAIALPHVAPIVTNTDDTGPGSLRQALVDAQDGDVITFNISSSTQPGAASVATTIALTSGELLIAHNVKLSGPGAALLQVSRDTSAGPFRIFHVAPGHIVAIEGLTVSAGVAQGSFPANAGGGIYNDHSTLTVNGCWLAANHASSYGGGLFNDGSLGNASLTIVNSTLSGNVGDVGGGGICNFGESSGNAVLAISNATLSSNSSASGGGILNDGSAGSATLSIANSTLNNNSAPNGGSTIYNSRILSGNATVEIGNTILKCADENILNVNGSIITRGYNLSSDRNSFLLGTNDQTETDPMLGPLKDNGGPTLTHAPLINSPAIDQGKRDVIPALAANFDQRGFVKPVDDFAVPNPSNGDGSDIGAVELAVGIHPASAGSWKTHGDAGTFVVGLPLVGPVGVECRSGGGSDDYQIRVVFAQQVTFGSAAITSGVGTISGTNMSAGPNGASGTVVTINLTGVTNVQTITVALFDVDNGASHADVGIRMGILLGDATGNANVNASDVSLIKLQSGEAVTEDNFRADIVGNGVINASDVSAAKLKSGTGLSNREL